VETDGCLRKKSTTAVRMRVDVDVDVDVDTPTLVAGTLAHVTHGCVQVAVLRPPRRAPLPVPQPHIVACFVMAHGP
jgi:hypothetical protein